MRFTTTVVTLLATLALAACAGTSFDWSQARQIKVGMTEAEVTEIMGAPYLVKSTAEGTVWVWSHANAFGGARSVSAGFKDGKVTSAPSVPQSFN